MAFRGSDRMEDGQKLRDVQVFGESPRVGVGDRQKNRQIGGQSARAKGKKQ